MSAMVTGGPEVPLPTSFGTFTLRIFTEAASGVEHAALSVPPTDPGAPRLVRLHSECLTGDIFGSYRCDCGEQLHESLRLIAKHGGVLLYLRGQEGRGIGLANKIRAYALQDAGADTVEANEQLGLPVDSRSYAGAAAILRQMGLLQIRLLSNNPAKAQGLTQYGIDVPGVMPLRMPSRTENLKYLRTKQEKMHHTLDLPTPESKDE